MDQDPNTPNLAMHALLTLLADDGGRTAALSMLHERALEVAGGTVSLLFEPHPATGHMQATSGAGVDALPADPWQPGSEESALVSQAFAARTAVAISHAAARMPALHRQVGTPGLILLPLLADTQRIGLVTVGLTSATEETASLLDGSEVRAGFLVALDLTRLRERQEFEREVRELLNAFAERLANSLDLRAALGPLCEEVTRSFAADRTTVWLHDREHRRLLPLASSDQYVLDRHPSVRADDTVASAAVALRTARASLATSSSDATSVLSIPLRGCRRALGTVVCEGVRVEAGDDFALLNRADELGRQLSAAIEARQLLDTVARSRLELEQLFASITDLIVIVDAEGAIVRANRSFSGAVGIDPEQLVRRPLTTCVGNQLASWFFALPPSLSGPAVCELTDDVLGGPYAVTVTELLAPQTSWRVMVASDLLPVLALRTPPA